MKSSKQVKDLIRNMAKQKDINAQILLRNYLFERLLERISLSAYKDHFILKGGLLIASLVGVDLRSTMDMDATIKGVPLTHTAIEEAFLAILALPMDDGVTLKLVKIEAIRDEDEYEGFRLSIEARLDQVRLPLKVDLTTGDSITPKEMDYRFGLLLEDRSIEILAYNLETVLAEKLETMLTRGTANTRLRDFYDVYVLLKFREEQLSTKQLASALAATARQRGSQKLLADAGDIYTEIFESPYMAQLWGRYQKKYSYAEGISWLDIRSAVFRLWAMASESPQ